MAGSCFAKDPVRRPRNILGQSSTIKCPPVGLAMTNHHGSKGALKTYVSMISPKLGDLELWIRPLDPSKYLKDLFLPGEEPFKPVSG